ncbi:MAG: DUF3173 family protein [Culicoidibacterales bacterium]
MKTKYTKKIISRDDLIDYGYSKTIAQNIIRQAKHTLVHQGFELYDNKRLGFVPREVVENIIGTKLGG